MWIFYKIIHHWALYCSVATSIICKDPSRKCQKYHLPLKQLILHVFISPWKFKAASHTESVWNWSQNGTNSLDFGLLVQHMVKNLGIVSIQRCHLTSIGIPMLKIKWSHNHLIFIMAIPLPGNMVFIFEVGLWFPCHVYVLWQKV